jgi:hypothetical protein
MPMAQAFQAILPAFPPLPLSISVDMSVDKATAQSASWALAR